LTFSDNQQSGTEEKMLANLRTQGDHDVATGRRFQALIAAAVLIQIVARHRASAGITNGRVFRRAEDPNDVVILQDVADVAKARTWLASDEMKAAMEKGGVVGSPNVRFAAAA
jgi:hypothetical protein